MVIAAAKMVTTLQQRGHNPKARASPKTSEGRRRREHGRRPRRRHVTVSNDRPLVQTASGSVSCVAALAFSRVNFLLPLIYLSFLPPSFSILSSPLPPHLYYFCSPFDSFCSYFSSPFSLCSSTSFTDIAAAAASPQVRPLCHVWRHARRASSTHHGYATRCFALYSSPHLRTSPVH